MMNKDQLTKIVAEKVDAAVKANVHPKKFFVTENGRGVVDGGDLYNAVFNDVLGVVKIALVDILEEALSNVKVQAPQVENKVSTGKNQPAPKGKK